MDSPTRRLTGIGFGFTAVATVYAVTGDFIKAGVSLAGFAVCLLWGFWPDIRRRKDGFKPGGVSVQVEVAEAKKGSVKLDDGRTLTDALRLSLLVTVHNDSERDATVRVAGLEFLSPGPWAKRQIPAEIHPMIRYDPVGDLADYNHFPEGQHTVPAKHARRHYFYFAVEANDRLMDSRVTLRLTVYSPSPHQTAIPLYK